MSSFPYRYQQAVASGALKSILAANAHRSTEGTSRGCGLFELVVADPPWPNRSIKRGRQYRVMAMSSSGRRGKSVDTMQSMLDMDIASVAAPGLSMLASG